MGKGVQEGPSQNAGCWTSIYLKSNMPRPEERKSTLSRENDDCNDTSRDASRSESETSLRGKEVDLTLSVLSPCIQCWLPFHPRSACRPLLGRL